MPMPWTYRHASKEWRAIPDDLRDQMDLISDKMAHTAMEVVLQVFRCHLTTQQGLDFAAVLPAIPRAVLWRAGRCRSRRHPLRIARR